MYRRPLRWLSLAEVQNIAEGRGLDIAGKGLYGIRSIILQDDFLRARAARNAPHLQELHEVISALNAAQSPFVSVGRLPLNPSSPIAILVGSGPISDVSTTYTPVYFPLKNEAALQPLLDAAKQASFGRGHQDILDPTYRRALVLHSDRFTFAPTGSLDPYALGIVDCIRETLLTPIENGDIPHRIVAVLDKLNVYAEGDFFKAHVDTPKSPDMFGTLLINLPVSHEGGQLIIRSPENPGEKASVQMPPGNDVDVSGNQVYVTNWGKDTGLEWVAFFSDCEHEVLPVTRGKRVTLSYTLSFEKPVIKHDVVDVEGLAGSRDLAREKLVDALKAPGVLRKGRSLCFHLQHQYPLDPGKTPVSLVVDQLKGRDAVIYHALQDAGASPTLHLVMFSDDEPLPADDTREDDRNEDDEDAAEEDADEEDADEEDADEEDADEEDADKKDADDDSDLDIAKSDDLKYGPFTIIYPYGATADDGIDLRTARTPPSRVLRWLEGRTPEDLPGLVEVTGGPPARYLKHSYMSYGNEASLSTDYGSICIIANVPGQDVNALWGPLVKPGPRLTIGDL